jgi:hypothetical protein
MDLHSYVVDETLVANGEIWFAFNFHPITNHLRHLTCWFIV